MKRKKIIQLTVDTIFMVALITLTQCMWNYFDKGVLATGVLDITISSLVCACLKWGLDTMTRNKKAK